MAKLREIILDTETTGLSAPNGDRIIEIGCVEMIDKTLTGNHFHQYINPERDIPYAAFKVHGISNERVANEPTFDKIAAKFLDFIGDDTLVIHNAPFDLGFLNHELERISLKNLRRMQVVDTVIMARKKFPGSPANLDALCRRFGVSLERRDKHGALLDANLLADVYIHLCGGPQAMMFAPAADARSAQHARPKKTALRAGIGIEQRAFPPSAEEIARHNEFIKKKVKDALWTA